MCVLSDRTLDVPLHVFPFKVFGERTLIKPKIILRKHFSHLFKFTSTVLQVVHDNLVTHRDHVRVLTIERVISNRGEPFLNVVRPTAEGFQVLLELLLMKQLVVGCKSRVVGIMSMETVLRQTV